MPEKVKRISDGAWKLGFLFFERDTERRHTGNVQNEIQLLILEVRGGGLD